MAPCFVLLAPVLADDSPSRALNCFGSSWVAAALCFAWLLVVLAGDLLSESMKRFRSVRVPVAPSSASLAEPVAAHSFAEIEGLETVPVARPASEVPPRSAGLCGTFPAGGAVVRPGGLVARGPVDALCCVVRVLVAAYRQP